MCLAGKPVVDGLEREFEGRALVLRADIQSDGGRAIADRYRLRVVPAFVVFDHAGEVVYREEGTRGVPLRDLRRALREGAASRD